MQLTFVPRSLTCSFAISDSWPSGFILAMTASSSYLAITNNAIPAILEVPVPRGKPCRIRMIASVIHKAMFKQRI